MSENLCPYCDKWGPEVTDKRPAWLAVYGCVCVETSEDDLKQITDQPPETQARFYGNAMRANLETVLEASAVGDKRTGLLWLIEHGVCYTQACAEIENKRKRKEDVNE